jgi:hypothetical protein
VDFLFPLGILALFSGVLLAWVRRPGAALVPLILGGAAWLFFSFLIEYARCDADYGSSCNRTPLAVANAVAAVGALSLVVGDVVLLSQRRELAVRLSKGLFVAAAVAFVVWLALSIGGAGQ